MTNELIEKMREELQKEANLLKDFREYGTEKMAKEQLHNFHVLEIFVEDVTGKEVTLKNWVVTIEG